MQRQRELSATVGVILASATFAAVGGCLTVPGTLLPVLVDAFKIRLVEAGSMFALQATAYVLSVATAGPVIQRCGMRAVLSIGMLGFAAGFGGFGVVSTWWGGATMLFISGLGFGVVEVALNTLLIALGGARRANLLNLAQLFFAVGAFVGPAAAARVVAGGVSWRTVFVVAGALAGAVALGWVVQPIHRAARADDSPAPANSTPLRSKLTIVMALMLGAYVGAEMGIGGWLSKYMVAVRGVDLSYAGTAVSLYWMGLAAGRLVLTVTSHLVSEERLVLGLTICAAAACAFGLVIPQPAPAVAAFALTGLGFSGIFPGVIALAGRYHPQNVAGITSVVITGAGIGGIIIPWVMSAIADGFGLVAGMGFYLAMCGVMVVLAVAINVLAPAGGSGEALGAAALEATTMPQPPHTDFNSNISG
jgi:FHS family glucose/mannose:H+ symporter-like MFS transporter